MGFGKFVQYLNAITPISAAEDLSACTVASFGNPNLKKESRQSTIKDLRKLLKFAQEIKPTNFAEVAKALAQGMKSG